LRRDGLDRLPPFGVEIGPEDLVPFDNLVEAYLERSDVERPDQPQSGRDGIEGTVWLNLAKEPESQLSI